MNILVNGSSFSRGPGSWPYLVQDAYGAELVNLSLAAAGNTYIQETTIAELGQRNYDLVIVMWSPFDRVDFKVKNVKPFSNTIYNSVHQAKMNDWKEKVIFPTNDQDYVEKDWIFGCGYLNNDPDVNLRAAFDGYYSNTSRGQQFYSNLIKVIALQGFLKSINQPYLFTFARQFRQFLRFDHLYNLLDRDRIYEVDLQAICKENNWVESDGVHPDQNAHKYYAKNIIEYIQQHNII